MSSMERKLKVVTIERQLETIDKLAIRVRVSFLAVRNNIGIVIQLFKKINYLNHPWPQLVQMIDVLLYKQLPEDCTGSAVGSFCSPLYTESNFHEFVIYFCVLEVAILLLMAFYFWKLFYHHHPCVFK